jgi:6,7-dimethyl-8-ribityllumazine synthase
MSPRALADQCGGVSRFGAMPKPTVTVRMEESGMSRSGMRRVHRRRESVRPDSGPNYEGTTMSERFKDTTNPGPLSATVASPSDRIAFVQSCWHKDIVDQCRDSFTAEIGKLGVAASKIDFFEVAGAFEIPLQAKLLAKSGRYAAIVASGFVVDGGIYRHEFVAETVIGALMRVQLDTEVPVISAVLTPQRFHDHDEHRKFFHAHFVVKGAEAAVACAGTIANMNRLKKLCA